MFKHSFALLALAISVPALAQQSQVVIGEAFDIDSQQLIYVEKHRYIEGNQHEVKYYDPNGDLFAEKRLRYGQYEQAPAF